jgi:CubicO group peptidase (beta-lactamase class C family)
MRRSAALGVLVVVGCTDPARDAAAAREPAVTSDSAVTVAALVGIEVAIEARRLELGVPGAAVVISNADGVLFQKGFGLRNVADSLPVTSRTLFGIGSCTKPFTALAAAISADSGLISLDDSPRKYLPYFALRDSTANANVNFRDLLSHRTGVPIDDAQGWYERHPTRERLIRFAMQGKPTAPFRQRFQYNNFMYLAAGEALAAAHRSSFPALMRALVFDPLGMRATTLSPAEANASGDFSYGYSGGPRAATRQAVEPRQLRYLRGIEPAGAIFTNAEDMGRWIRMMVRGGTLDSTRLVSAKSYAEMLAPAVRTAGHQYGLGWYIESWHGTTLYSHAGGVTGFGARCEFAPAFRLGWVVLTNIDDGSLPRAVREIVYEKLVRPSP